MIIFVLYLIVHFISFIFLDYFIDSFTASNLLLFALVMFIIITLSGLFIKKYIIKNSSDRRLFIVMLLTGYFLYVIILYTTYSDFFESLVYINLQLLKKIDKSRIIVNCVKITNCRRSSRFFALLEVDDNYYNILIFLPFIIAYLQFKKPSAFRSVSRS